MTQTCMHVSKCKNNKIKGEKKKKYCFPKLIPKRTIYSTVKIQNWCTIHMSTLHKLCWPNTSNTKQTATLAFLKGPFALRVSGILS
jgi:hypothetical protein